MDISEFPYSSKFISPLTNVEIKNNVSLASLEGLRPLIKQAIDAEENIDLLTTAYDACIVNMANENGDAIDSKTAYSIYKKFIHKPTNIEHVREQVVGHIINAGFRDMQTGELIDPEVAKDKTDPFYLSLAAVVYKLVNKNFSLALIESNDPTSEFHESIAASWEMMFNKYDLMIGDREVSKASIITDDDEKKRLMEFVKANDGKRVDSEGRQIHRLIRGEPIPLGTGYTENPAAKVRGVLLGSKTEPVIETPKVTKKENIYKNMDIKTIEDLVLFLSDADESKASVTKYAKASEFIKNELQKALNDQAEKTKVEKAAKDTEVSTANTRIGALEVELDEMRSDLNSAKELSETLKNEKISLAEKLNLQESTARKEKRVNRFAELNNPAVKASSFDLQIEGLNDEDFDKWFNESLASLCVDKSKEGKTTEETPVLEIKASKNSQIPASFSREQFLAKNEGKMNYTYKLV